MHGTMKTKFRGLEIRWLPCEVESGTWPLVRTEGNAVHNLLNDPKTQRRREIFTERKSLKIKKETPFCENCGVQQNYRSEKTEGLLCVDINYKK